MADLTGRIDEITKDYINKGAYFTISRTRQFVTTTQ